MTATTASVVQDVTNLLVVTHHRPAGGRSQVAVDIAADPDRAAAALTALARIGLTVIACRATRHGVTVADELGRLGKAADLVERTVR